MESWEEPALEYAGQCAGEYIESIQKTDLAKFTPEEWRIFLQVIALNFSQKRAESQSCPF